MHSKIPASSEESTTTYISAAMAAMAGTWHDAGRLVPTVEFGALAGPRFAHDCLLASQPLFYDILI